MKISVERARVRGRGEGAGTVPAPGARAAVPAARTAGRTRGVRDTDGAEARLVRVRYRKVFACAAEANDSPDEDPL